MTPKTDQASSLAQEIAEKCATELYGNLRHDDITDRLQAIISEGIAPLEKELSEIKAYRKAIRDSFGHQDGTRSCQCPYCRKDIDALCDMAAEYEMQRYHAKAKLAPLERERDQLLRLHPQIAKLEQELKTHVAKIRNQKREIGRLQELHERASAELAKRQNCCGDAHQELQVTLDWVTQLGFERETIKHETHTEQIWHNKRAEAAESSLSGLSLAAEELLKATNEPVTPHNWRLWAEQIWAAAERARSLVVK